MFNWINAVASEMDYIVNGFYGFKDNIYNINNITSNDCYLFSNIYFKDGAGLEDNSRIIKFNIYFIILLLNIFLL